MSSDKPAATFTCPRCEATSSNTFDVLEGYCGACHDWTRDDPLDAFRPRYYDPDGEPIPMRCWAELMERRAREGFADWWKVGETQVRDGVSVSTVWLGLDHAFMGGPPMIFETMVFGGPLHQDMERYSTREAARAGHERWVAAARRDDTEGG